MKNLRLIPAVHKNQAIVKAHFAFDKDIIALVKTQDRSELLNLKIRDIDSSRNLVRINGGKGNKDRQSILSEKLLDQLREYFIKYKPKKWLFEGVKEKQYSPSSISKILSRAAKVAGIQKRVTPHMLRHSFATHLLEQGVSLKPIQVLLGHNSSKTTELYTRVSVQEIGKIKNPLDDFYI